MEVMDVKTTPVILCLDDHITELMPHLEALATAISAEVLTTQTAAQAIALADSCTVDLFILDIELGRQESSGLRLAQQWRLDERYRRTPILFISMYSHYSQYVLSTVEHGGFLSKPFSTEALTNKVGRLLGIERFLAQAYADVKLTVPTASGGFVEVDPYRVRCIELIRSELNVQYTDGQTMTFKSSHGCFKTLLADVERLGITHLRQIYRSVIINVHQIRQLTLEKNRGEVLLFHDDIPKPVGNRYRDRLKEFL